MGRKQHRCGRQRGVVLTSRHVAILRRDDHSCKSVFDANVSADCCRSYRCGCNEGIEQSLRFQLDYGLGRKLNQHNASILLPLECARRGCKIVARLARYFVTKCFARPSPWITANSASGEIRIDQLKAVEPHFGFISSNIAQLHKHRSEWTRCFAKPNRRRLQWSRSHPREWMMAGANCLLCGTFIIEPGCHH